MGEREVVKLFLRSGISRNGCGYCPAVGPQQIFSPDEVNVWKMVLYGELGWRGTREKSGRCPQDIICCNHVRLGPHLKRSNTAILSWLRHWSQFFPGDQHKIEYLTLASGHTAARSANHKLRVPFPSGSLTHFGRPLPGGPMRESDQGPLVDPTGFMSSFTSIVLAFCHGEGPHIRRTPKFQDQRCRQSIQIGGRGEMDGPEHAMSGKAQCAAR